VWIFHSLLRLLCNGGSAAGQTAALAALAGLVATLVATDEEAVPARFDFGTAFLRGARVFG